MKWVELFGHYDASMWILGAVAVVVIVGVVWRVKWKAGWRQRRGRMGERMVAEELKRLKRRDTVVLNDVLLPVISARGTRMSQTGKATSARGTRMAQTGKAQDEQQLNSQGEDSSGWQGRSSQIDHIVVSTRGIFLIETKSHAGGIVGSEFSQYWTQYAGGQRRRLYNPLLQNATHIRTLQRLLPDVDKDLFTSMVVFTAASNIKVKADDIVIPRSFLPDRRIRRTLIPSERKKRRWWWPWGEVRLDEAKIVTPLEGLVDEIRRRRRVMDRDEVNEIAEAIAGRAIHGGAATRHHTAYAKETAKHVNRSIRQGNCPRCGGVLVVMKGERGEYLACAEYPACRFTAPLD